MSDPYIAQIMPFGGNFAIRGWALCQGQLLAISQNSALFSILGTTYGGDGRTTFGLPDLRGRTIIGPGNGPGLPSYQWGQKGGQASVTLNVQQIPSHNHSVTLHGERGASNATSPGGNLLATGGSYAAYNAANADPAMAPQSIQQVNVGGSQPHDNMMPYTAIYYEIALVGIFPSRN